MDDALEMQKTEAKEATVESNSEEIKEEAQIDETEKEVSSEQKGEDDSEDLTEDEEAENNKATAIPTTTLKSGRKSKYELP